MPIKYVGGKEKYASEILEIILPGNEHRPYFEPFVGSASMLVAVPTTMQRFANDKNPYLVAMHEAVRDGWVPPSEVTEEQYQTIKRNPSGYPKELVAFVSIACSFGAKMWGGYARCNRSHVNYASEGVRGLMKTVEQLQGVSFTSCDYQDLIIPQGALVYCDPPYQGTTDYGDYKIQSGDFWRWCNKLVTQDCKVFVSGYKGNKVSGWEVVWSSETRTQINNSNGVVSKTRQARIECLFRPLQKHVDHLKAGQMCECWKTAEDLEREARLAA